MKKTMLPGIRIRHIIYSCWVLLRLNLNKEFPRFNGRTVANSGELIQLNTTNLNKDANKFSRRSTIMSRSGAAHG